MTARAGSQTTAHTGEDSGETRTAILDAAGALLADEGPEALTVRRIAQRAGCSTMGLYTHFGGKEGVVEELFVEGFRRLTAAIDGVRTTDDPLDDLGRSCAAYRRFALANRTHYAVMFARAVPDFEPRPEAKLVASRSLGALERRIQRCLDAGAIDPGHGPAADVAFVVWAGAHGMVSLELERIGPRSEFASLYRTSTTLMLTGLVHPPIGLRRRSRG
jgi:AcrR family transcriptional regulator